MKLNISVNEQTYFHIVAYPEGGLRGLQPPPLAVLWNTFYILKDKLQTMIILKTVLNTTYYL